MFQCYKCGYKDFSNKEKTSCPICGTIVIVPKFVLILFLSFVGFIVFTFLSMFEHSLNILSTAFIILAVMVLLFAIIEVLKRKNEIQDGFRVPEFESYGYVCGLNNDDGVKKIMIETYKDGLNLYHNNLQEVVTVDYSDIVGLELQSEVNIKQSSAKSLFYGVTFGALGGLGAGMLGVALGGIKAEDVYFLELQIKENDAVHSLYISDSKSRLLNLAHGIENKLNGE